LALGWSALQTVGVAASAALWASGHGNDQDAHYALQRWWAEQLVRILRRSVGLTYEVEGLNLVAPGPIVMCAQHASLIDALGPMWLFGQVGMHPRYVLKDALQLDPCLDIVGNRLPNHFIDPNPSDSATETAALELLADHLSQRDACVIFPEGRITTAGEPDHGRAAGRRRSRTRSLPLASALTMLAPVRPTGTAALLHGVPDADLVFVTHTGQETLQQVTDAPRQMPLRRPVRIQIARVPRCDIPAGAAFPDWLDTQWARLDHELSSSRHVLLEAARSSADNRARIGDRDPLLRGR
jgi:1-acyl-sn-glycerol-3-phosphate acyltransferase